MKRNDKYWRGWVLIAPTVGFVCGMLFMLVFCFTGIAEPQPAQAFIEFPEEGEIGYLDHTVVERWLVNNRVWIVAYYNEPYWTPTPVTIEQFPTNVPPPTPIPTATPVGVSNMPIIKVTGDP